MRYHLFYTSITFLTLILTKSQMKKDSMLEVCNVNQAITASWRDMAPGVLLQSRLSQHILSHDS